MTKLKLQNILKAGISVDFWAIMYIIALGEDPRGRDTGKIDGLMLIMQKKSLLDQNYQLTAQGALLLSEIETGNTSVTEKTTPVIQAANSFKKWTEELYIKLQDKMVELTGNKQKTISKKYAFLCNSTDLASQLQKVINKYKLGTQDLDKIETLLLRHIENSYKAKWEMVSLIYYYILKEGHSRLVTDLENFEEYEIEKVETTTQKFI